MAILLTALTDCRNFNTILLDHDVPKNSPDLPKTDRGENRGKPDVI
jgi:hypothetical protein